MSDRSEVTAEYHVSFSVPLSYDGNMHDLSTFLTASSLFVVVKAGYTCIAMYVFIL